MYKKILVPYDKSDPAKNALGAALDLAAGVPGAQITVLSVVDWHDFNAETFKIASRMSGVMGDTMDMDVISEVENEAIKADMDAIAVAVGPGSFTGVRIGVAAAKGFAWGREVPCYGVSTLEAMALSLGEYQGYVCPVMDARRSQVYNALFYVNHGSLKRITEDRAIALAQLKQELAHLTEPVFLVGDGSVLTYKTLSGDIPNLIMPPEHRMYQRAAGVALLAAQKQAAGETGDGAALTPNYLRLSQAERERLERESANS